MFVQTSPPYSGTANGWTWAIGGDASTCTHATFSATFVIEKASGGTLTMTVTVSGPIIGTISSTYTRP